MAASGVSVVNEASKVTASEVFQVYALQSY